MDYEILSWILSVEEDNPIPYEIKHIYFFISDGVVGFGGTEYKQKIICNFDYYPLDAQYFDYSEKIAYDEKVMLVLKNILIEVFEKRQVKKIFKNKTIYIGEYNKKPIFSFFV